LSLNLCAVFAFFFVSFLPGVAVWAEDLNIYFKTTPRIELLRPYADPANMSLLITGADGRPVKQGVVDIRLDAPEPGRFFSTDFPFVEGTRLSEMRMELRQGRANWKFLFPIRGEYRLAVVVRTADGGKASKDFKFYVRENQKKWFALTGFSIGLFLLGLLAGRVFTAVPKSAMIVLFAVALLVESSQAAEPPGIPETENAGLEIEAGTVGTPTAVRWFLTNAEMAAKQNTLLTLTITHLEKEKIAFAVERIPVDNEFSMKFQFTDGAEYRVVALAEVPGKSPLRSEKVIGVTATEPPAKASVPALAYFVGLIALGLGAGRWTKRRTVVP
jgi:hypothetical protein